MEWFQVVVLALVQGLTEFLPISSSAHLILFPRLLGWQDQGLAFDIGVHLGTLLAVLGYFRNEVKLLAVAWLKTLYRRTSSAEGRLAWGLVVGTIPVGLAGVLFNDLIESTLRSGLVIALSTLFFGLLLWWADARGRGQLGLEMIGWKAIVVIGLAQALALIPGTSRSGITITAGLAMGLTRQAGGPLLLSSLHSSHSPRRGLAGRHSRGPFGGGDVGESGARGTACGHQCFPHHPLVSEAGGASRPSPLCGLSAGTWPAAASGIAHKLSLTPCSASAPP